MLLRELALEARVLGRSGFLVGAGVELVSRLSMSGRWKGCLLGEAVQIGESMCIVCWVEHREDFTRGVGTDLARARARARAREIESLCGEGCATPSARVAGFPAEQHFERRRPGVARGPGWPECVEDEAFSFAFTATPLDLNRFAHGSLTHLTRQRSRSPLEPTSFRDALQGQRYRSGNSTHICSI